MNVNKARGVSLVVSAIALAFVFAPRPGLAASAADIDRQVTAALADLYAKSPTAKMLSEQAKGVLVFPSIVFLRFLPGFPGVIRTVGRSGSAARLRTRQIESI